MWVDALAMVGTLTGFQVAEEAKVAGLSVAVLLHPGLNDFGASGIFAQHAADATPDFFQVRLRAANKPCMDFAQFGGQPLTLGIGGNLKRVGPVKLESEGPPDA